MVLSPDGRLLACSSGGFGMDHAVRLWNLRSRYEPRILTGDSRSVTCLAMSGDGQFLASGSGDCTIRLWSTELARLNQLPAARASLKDLAWLQAARREENLSEREQRAFAFLEALLRWRHRLDIFVEEGSPRRPEPGVFDIEIEQ
jgi:hypothetical protein